MRRLLLLSVMATVMAACNGDSAVIQPLATSAPPTPPPSATASATPSVTPPATPSCSGRGPGDYEDSVTRFEGERTYRVHVPPGYDGRSTVPVVFNFHGQGRTAEHQDRYSQLAPVADAEGFILVTPQGFQNQWNIRGIFGDESVDDVGAVEAMLDRLEAEFCVDTLRVFATGLSNGGEMASQVGCFLPDRFAAIAPVAGILFQECEGAPVAVITFHGTDDFNVPYDTALEAIPQWAAHNGCVETPATERIASQVVVESFRGCSVPVVFYTLESAGHTWPGAEDGTGGVGVTNHEINASEVLWEFFQTVRRTP